MVQGVGFRFYVRRTARELGITGYVRNTPDGRAVEVMAEGQRENLDQMVKLLQIGPRLSKVVKIEVEWLEHQNAFSNFDIRF
jgi:acylphosphatase